MSKLLTGQTSHRIEVKGYILANANDVEAVAVYNKSSNKGTITNENGHFVLEVAEHDIIEISALQFETQKINITKDVIESGFLKIYLVEQINELREVTVGNTLSGDLLLDIQNRKGKPPINFYDVGIPGYTGRIATQSERKLHQAGAFKPSMLIGILLGSGSLDPIINGISGRTKMLKNRVELEEKEALMQRIKGRLAKDFFVENPLEEHLRLEFLYFCADDENFIQLCKNQTDFEIFKFLKTKYKQYITNGDDTQD